MNRLDLIKLLLDEGRLDVSTKKTSGHWQIGKEYVVRTVTMIYLGVLKSIDETELLLEDCAWIPDTSRWNEFLDGKKPNEMEPYKEDVIIGRCSILDATIMTKKIKREVL